MSEARDYLQKAPWIIVFNGLALFLVVTVFQLFGDRLSEFVHRKKQEQKIKFKMKPPATRKGGQMIP